MAVLTTRIYRSSGGEGILGAEEVAEEIEERSPAISAIALGGSAKLEEMQAYTMKSCFVDDMCVPEDLRVALWMRAPVWLNDSMSICNAQEHCCRAQVRTERQNDVERGQGERQ
jgi:hypothetical protein